MDGNLNNAHATSKDLNNSAIKVTMSEGLVNIPFVCDLRMNSYVHTVTTNTDHIESFKEKENDYFCSPDTRITIFFVEQRPLLIYARAHSNALKLFF